jgi:hypothetical protein
VLRDEQRPWIRIDAAIGSGLVVSENEARITIVFRMTNVGHSPAFRAFLYKEVYLGTGTTDPMADERAFCDTHRRREGSAQYLGQILFPGDPSTEADSIGFSISNMKEAMAVYAGNAANVFIIGCADYQFATGGSVHQTRLILRIIHATNIKPESGIAIDLRNREIPAGELSLDKFGFGEGDIAD